MEGNNFQFKLLSLNVREIRSFEKRKCIFNWFLKQKADIFFVQETYSRKEIENQWRKQWRGDLFFSHGTSHSKGVLVGDLFNEICIKPHTTLQNLNALDLLFLNGLYDCLPPEWKKAMSNDPASVLIKINHNRDDVFLYSGNDAILFSELSSKKIYNILVSKMLISPSTKRKFDATYASTEQALDWKSIYSNAFRRTIDTKTHEFQYKILNRILPLNDLLFKIGKTNSPLCSFCQSSEENMSHFFFHCPLVANFWQSIKHLLGGYELIEREVILGSPISDHLTRSCNDLAMAKMTEQP